MQNTCPPADALLGYLHGKTCEAQAQTLEIHIEDCSACQLLLENLSEVPDSLMQGVVGAARSRATDQSSYLEVVVSSNSQNDSSLRQASAEPQTKIIGGCRVLECIGQGGMGSVYRAWHVGLDKQVALKILKPERMESPEAISRFALEMKLLAQLEHNNIVRAMDGGVQEGLPYFVMEFVAGINLQQLLRRLGPLPVADACHITAHAASALQYAHEQDVIHRDIKPSNLMLTPEGNIKLLDLGLAHTLKRDGEDGLTRVDQILGTLDYMSPEQRLSRRKVTNQSDIFSLGVTLHELLTGLRPNGHHGIPPQASEIRSIRPDVDSALVALVSDMLAVVPSKRPLSMAEVELRLKSISSPTDLSVLVAEYYRWSNRGVSALNRGFARADTEATAARSTDRQSTNAVMGITNSSNSLLTASRWNSTNLVTWSQSIAIVGCIVAMSWMAFTMWPTDRSEPPPTQSEMQSLLKPELLPEASNVFWIGEGEFAAELLERGIVSIEDPITKVVYELVNGNMQVAPGEYLLHYDAPIKFQAENSTIKIASASKQTQRIEAQLSEGFQFPVLPSVGSFGTYHGTIWHEGWGDRQEQMSYTLYLEVLNEVNEPGSPTMKWLQVGITDQAQRYTENAYIKVDTKRWENQKQLEICEGWVEATSPAIEQFLKERGLPSINSGLVVPFDRQHDLLSEVKGLDLTKRRLRAQDAIALFFAVEDQIPVAAKPIRTARQMLSASKRFEWLGTAKAAFGTPFCYVASTRTKDMDDSAPGYRLARRTSDAFHPFGIVEIQVSLPILEATCTLKNAGTIATDAVVANTQRIENKLKRLSQDADSLVASLRDSRNQTNTATAEQTIQFEYIKWFAERAFSAFAHAAKATVPATVRVEQSPSQEVTALATAPIGRFDLALMPKTPAFTTWTGKISHGKLRNETIKSTARVLGTEVIDGREYRWIEVDIRSMMEGEPDYWEGTRLLVDATAYDNDHVFQIKQGWIAYGEPTNVFRIPASRNLDELLDIRLQLQQRPRFDRLTAVDALSMLFNAEMRPLTPISKLRATISGLLAGSNRTSIAETRDLRIGKVVGECWKSPELPGLNYSFFRSQQVPFGFASVTLTAGVISIELEADNGTDSPLDEYSSSLFGNPAQLSELAVRNSARLPSDPNWRVWAWRDRGTTYKVWAEFGGTIKRPSGREVLLRNKRKNEICIPEILLEENDIEFLAKGRHWASFNNQQRVLLEDSGNELKLRLTNGSETSHVGTLAKTPDNDWLDALRTVDKRKVGMNNSAKHWTAFAGYVR